MHRRKGGQTLSLALYSAKSPCTYSIYTRGRRIAMLTRAKIIELTRLSRCIYSVCTRRSCRDMYIVLLLCKVSPWRASCPGGQMRRRVHGCTRRRKDFNGGYIGFGRHGGCAYYVF